MTRPATVPGDLRHPLQQRLPVPSLNPLPYFRESTVVYHQIQIRHGSSVLLPTSPEIGAAATEIDPTGDCPPFGTVSAADSIAVTMNWWRFVAAWRL